MANTETTLDLYHQAVRDQIAAAFPDLKTVAWYHEEDERNDKLALPACLLEVTDMPTEGDRDPQTGQMAFNLRVEARLVIGFRTPKAKLEIRKLSSALAVWMRDRRFQPASGPADVLGAFRDDFSPVLDQFEVWRVEWDQIVHLGESVWVDDGETPDQPVYSWSPDIGTGNADKYQDAVPDLGGV